MDCLEDSNYNFDLVLDSSQRPRSHLSSFSDSSRCSVQSHPFVPASSQYPGINVVPATTFQMDSSNDSTDERTHASKRKFWSRVRRTRERRRSLKEAYRIPSIFSVCSRRSTRNFIRLSYLAAACAFSSLITLYLNSTYISDFDMAFGAFSHPDGLPLDVNAPQYPGTFLRSVMPVPCHSHNDQWRHTPLHAALGSGCVSIEADVWAAAEPTASEIFVGHDQGQLLPDRTLQKMYVDPLMNLLELHNAPAKAMTKGPEDNLKKYGVFAASPFTSLTLLLDFKSPSRDLFPALLSAIQPLIQKDWLTRWDPDTQTRVEGPITIVASGLADFDIILRGGNISANAPIEVARYVFYDAPLSELVRPGDPDAPPSHDAINIDLNLVPAVPDAEAAAADHKHEANAAAAQLRRYRFNPSNSHLASTSLSSAVGAVSPLLGHPDAFQRKILRRQIRAARDRGLVSRYWGTPRWPRGLRDGVWECLESEGVGLLNVDDLRGVRRGHWGKGAGGRWWGPKGRGLFGWVPDYRA